MQQNILFIIISHTPFWVWILLIFLIKRGIGISEDRQINIPKSFIVPTVFIFLGLEKIATKFLYSAFDFVVYLLLVPFGIVIGYIIYKKNQRYFLHQGELYKRKCYLPLIIILVNFMVKYILNVAIGINPSFISNFEFNICYSIICGLSVGLFLGGILNTFVEKKKIIRMEN